MGHRPNVMFIIADQHNAKCLGCAGHPQVQTPNLDAMAARGVRFAGAITTSPICTPSRLSYLTGQYPHNHGHYGNGGNAPDRLPSLMAHVRRHGYRTASIGHINEPFRWLFVAAAGCIAVGLAFLFAMEERPLRGEAVHAPLGDHPAPDDLTPSTSPSA